jgi:ASC-1-like (ASCH) protein
MKTHNLKIIQPYFDKLKAGTKKWELRFNDRDYRIGDALILQEYDPSNKTYSGESLTAHVVDIFYGAGDGKSSYGLIEGYCLMSIVI